MFWGLRKKSELPLWNIRPADLQSITARSGAYIRLVQAAQIRRKPDTVEGLQQQIPALGYRFMDLYDGLNTYGSGLSMQLTLNYLVNSNLQHLTLWPWKQFLMIHPHFRSKKEVKKWLLYDWWQIWSQNVTAKQKLAEKKRFPWDGKGRNESIFW